MDWKFNYNTINYKNYLINYRISTKSLLIKLQNILFAVVKECCILMSKIIFIFVIFANNIIKKNYINNYIGKMCKNKALIWLWNISKNAFNQ